MAVKRVVSTSFWTDSKVDMFSPEDKYFMLYLLTNPHTTQLGIYELPIKHAAFELGYSQESVAALLDRFETKYGIIMRSAKTNEIAIKNYLKHSVVKGGKPVLDCLNKELKSVKDKSLVRFICDANRNNENATVEEFINNTVTILLNDNDNDNDNERIVDESYPESSKPTSTKKTKHFAKPTVAEVAAYCAERNNEIDAQYFVDYYEVRGWCAGKARMKDWKAAVRTWESNSKKNKSQATIKQSKPVGFNQGLKQFANAFSIGEQDDSSSFEEFWKVYPNKYGYGDAERVWNDIQPDAALAKRIIEIAGRITKVEKYSGDGAAFIPSPEKWLSGKHWEDEILQPPKTYSYEFTGINSNSVEENAKRTRVKVKVTEND